MYLLSEVNLLSRVFQNIYIVFPIYCIGELRNGLKEMAVDIRFISFIKNILHIPFK